MSDYPLMRLLSELGRMMSPRSEIKDTFTRVERAHRKASLFARARSMEHPDLWADQVCQIVATTQSHA